MHDVVLLQRKLGIGIAHQASELGNEREEKRPFLTELVAMSNGAPNDASKHIPAPFVAGDHPIDDEKGAGTNVISDDPQRRRREVPRAGRARSVRDQIAEQIDVVIAVHVLQDSGETLETHPGVDARPRQRRHHALVVPIELHEHEVPDLHVAIAFVGRAGRLAWNIRTVVVEDFAAGAAGPRLSHLPEIIRCVWRAPVVSDANDSVDRHADVVRPCGVRLIVGMVDADPESFRGQLIDLGQQLPRKPDGLALEVVAERPVPEHLEKRVVSCGVADIFEIVVFSAGTQATLHVRSAHVAARFLPQENFLELDHAAVGEQQRRIVGRDQRRGRHDGVPARGEVIEETAADIGGFHGLVRCHSIHGRLPTPPGQAVNSIC